MDIFDVRDVLFSFKGRIRRRTWWIASICTNISWGIATRLAGGAALRRDGEDLGARLVILAIDLFCLWPWLALTIKRRHDRATSGWLAASVTALATFGNWAPDRWYGFDAGSGPSVFGWALVGIGLAAAVWLLVVLGFLDGTQGPNRYGPSPKGIGGTLESTAETFS